MSINKKFGIFILAGVFIGSSVGVKVGVVFQSQIIGETLGLICGILIARFLASILIVHSNK